MTWLYSNDLHESIVDRQKMQLMFDDIGIAVPLSWNMISMSIEG
jgi:hypothetical protein